MTQTYFPFDKGPGSDATEAEWTKMAQHWMNTGVIKGVFANLEVYADATGMQVKVAEGAAWIKGHYYESDNVEIVPIGAADYTYPRIDRVVLRLDWSDDSIKLAVLQGVPASSPVPPAVTQNGDRWELPLARVQVGAGVPTIAPGTIDDDRVYIYKNDYPGTLLSIGYMKHPNGIIEQWGYIDITNHPANAWLATGVVFPVAFPNQCFVVTSEVLGSVGPYGNTNNGYYTKESFTLYSKMETAGQTTLVWRAIGV